MKSVVVAEFKAVDDMVEVTSQVEKLIGGSLPSQEIGANSNSEPNAVDLLQRGTSRLFRWSNCSSHPERAERQCLQRVVHILRDT
jgi:hypothetical protein